ncbi:2-amino-4-hydroxy-6-hydroxymethyldihydropteridine diphosphokinase [Roseiconus nitratireducens]|uniref:2-amino-4-hydroxy-6-hydroxymethyldihydropteridine pyrophosphokinase n=1 Tax=Roseiconus nitratireducens TaxID=2605748 RepID=A0A5M6DKP2_9BACT|nr:2-amino-4-hydroxy-6-hydroxymethyldihydropteridine diphosphokinase [Roseiconus nitratireducens]KAA5546956.1 2-amino-4-hydroxy-6-hydroxymethyldihydropteridine diphosphokinase [Roseiconus nitratireducens]
MTAPDHPLSPPPPAGSPSATDRDGPATSQCVISFGSNLGDRHELLTAAAREIARSPHVLQPGGLQTSRLFETPPIGGPGGQEPFLNAIGAFETTASAKEVLSMLQELELALGRERRHRWGARSIDLDIVLHGQLIGVATGLVVPHPRYTARQFVLKPACDVAGHFRDPRFGWSLSELASHLSAGVPSLALVSGSQQLRRLLCTRLSREHGILTYVAAQDSRQVTTAATFPGRPSPVTSTVPPGFASGLPAAEEVADTAHCRPVTDGQIPPPSGPWVSDFLPSLPTGLHPPDLPAPQQARVPRLIARIQGGPDHSGWPATHQMWPGGWRWPEYRLEIDDLDWAVSELASALDSMRCTAEPITDDGHWW